MGEWKTRIGDTVEIGQELGTILTGAPLRAINWERRRMRRLMEKKKL